jgi:hypothetical protein
MARATTKAYIKITPNISVFMALNFFRVKQYVNQIGKYRDCDDE